MQAKLDKCLESFRRITDFRAEVGIVLGSGLGKIAQVLELEKVIAYAELEGFPTSTVEGHEGKFLLGSLAGKKTIIMQGRIHYYEGYEMADVILPHRLMAQIGVKTMLLSNSAGGINPDFEAGDFMIIQDHLSIFVPNPLRGQNLDSLGSRFPDMSQVYDPQLQELARKTAAEQGIKIKQGVYCQVPGPSFETPAEIKMIEVLGGDAVGMSTACEAEALRHMSVQVLGISLISNLAAGRAKTKLTHTEVQETASRLEAKFADLIQAIVARL